MAKVSGQTRVEDYGTWQKEVDAADSETKHKLKEAKAQEIVEEFRFNIFDLIEQLENWNFQPHEIKGYLVFAYPTHDILLDAVIRDASSDSEGDEIMSN